MGMSISALFISKVEEEISNRLEDLGSGSASDFPDYKYRVGYMEGLTFSKTEFLDILSKIERDG